MNSLIRQFARGWRLAVGGLALAGVIDLRARSFSSNFNDGQPPEVWFTGTAFWSDTGGVGNSGVVKLTEAVNGQMGSMLINDLDGGSEITGFTARWKMKLGGGTVRPADGLSFNFAPDLLDWWAFGEEGAGSGITISFDTWDNGGGEAPAIDVKSGGMVIASARGNLELFRTGDFVEVLA